MASSGTEILAPMFVLPCFERIAFYDFIISMILQVLKKLGMGLPVQNYSSNRNKRVCAVSLSSREWEQETETDNQPKYNNRRIRCA